LEEDDEGRGGEHFEETLAPGFADVLLHRVQTFAFK
jgi:hypothetical protein